MLRALDAASAARAASGGVCDSRIRIKWTGGSWRRSSARRRNVCETKLWLVARLRTALVDENSGGDGDGARDGERGGTVLQDGVARGRGGRAGFHVGGDDGF